jgi:hypothetical protein
VRSCAAALGFLRLFENPLRCAFWSLCLRASLFAARDGTGVVGATRSFLLGLMGSCVGRPGGVKDSAVPESLLVSFGFGVRTRPSTGLAAGVEVRLRVGLAVNSPSVLTDLLRIGSLAAGFGRDGRLSSLFHAATRSAMTSALTTLCFGGPDAVVGVGRTARLGCLIESRATDFVVGAVD